MCADVLKVSIKNEASAKLRMIVDRMKNPGPWLREVAGPAIQASVDEEFATRTWKSPSGALIPWAPRSPASERMTDFVSHPLLEESGTLRDAWAGRNGNSILRVSGNTVTVGVSGLPYAGVQRGGEGSNVSAGTITSIAVTARMRIFLGVVKGLWLKKDTASINIPARPHGTASPQLAADLAAKGKDYYLTGRLRDASGRFRATG